MKKISYLFLFLLFASNVFLHASERSRDEVFAIAHQKLNQKFFKYKALNTRLFNSQQQVSSIEVVDSSSSYYVLNGDSSFVVVSSDNRLPQVLGYGFESSLDPNDLPPAMSYLLSLYDTQLAVLDSMGVEKVEDLQETVSFTGDAISPLLRTKWGQGTPFNDRTPLDGDCRAATGCVATAMAQIMKFHQYPTKGTGSHAYEWNDQTLSADFKNTTYDYANMLDDYSEDYNEIQASAVATLMHHCGVAVEMNYGCDGSSASLEDGTVALHDFFGYDINYQCIRPAFFSYDSLCNLLHNELKHNRPVLTRGTDSDSGGHAFVLDGNDENGLFHINWGWKGTDNAYFNLTALNPETQSFQFNNNVRFYIGIQPQTSSSVPPVPQLWGELNVVELTENPLEDGACTSDRQVYVYLTMYNVGMHDVTGTVSFMLSDENGNTTTVRELERPFISGYSRTIAVPITYNTIPSGVYKLYATYRDNNYVLNEIPNLDGDNYKTIQISSQSLCVLTNEKEPILTTTQKPFFKKDNQPTNQYKQERTGGQLWFTIENTGRVFNGEIQARILNDDDSVGIFGTYTGITINRQMSAQGLISGSFGQEIANNTLYKIKLYWRENGEREWKEFTSNENDTILFKIFAYTTDISDNACIKEDYDRYEFYFNAQSFTENETTKDTVRIIPISNKQDSVVHLHLTVYPSYNDTFAVRQCEGIPYIWDGITYTSDTIVTNQYQTINLCDSFVTLNISFHSTYHDTMNISLCGEESYTWEGTTYTESGMYSKELSAVLGGCDSIVTLLLSFPPTYMHTYYDTICLNETSTFDNQQYTQPGTFILKDTFLTEKGCDSIETMSLTVLLPDTNVITDSINVTSTLFPYQIDEYAVLPAPINKDTSFCININTIKCTVNKYEIKITKQETQLATITTQPIKLMITDCLGKVVQIYTSNIPSITDIDLPCGVYILHYSYSDGTSQIKKEILCKK